MFFHIIFAVFKYKGLSFISSIISVVASRAMRAAAALRKSKREEYSVLSAEGHNFFSFFIITGLKGR